MTSQPTAEQQQTWQVADCFFELIGRIVGEAEQLAQQIGIPVPFVKALHIMDCPLAMKELGKRMHCDPSFVTLVADMLEKRGLARREPHPADRRVKNLVLTDDGLALKQRIESEITARMPWTQFLDSEERSQLLALIRKMLGTDADGAPGTGPGKPDAMHGPLANLLATALQESAGHLRAAADTDAPHAQPQPETDTSPRTATGEVTRDVSETSAGR